MMISKHCFKNSVLKQMYWVPLSMGFSKHEYWSGLRCPSPGNSGIEPRFPTFQADSLPSEPPGKLTACSSSS